jgi:dTDP-4-dehydrorhamnose reductase
MRVAVTGAGGRLGRALLATLQAAPFPAETLAWDLPEYDLDDPESAGRHIAAGRPDAVIHAAAWTDVDGCARDPDLALRRNGRAAGEMAQACAERGIALVVVSTNEVFDGRRTDRQPYRPDDPPDPPNPYGRAKLAGELEARQAFGIGPDEQAKWDPPLAIVRTSWLFGAPGGDFPRKILASARAAAAEGRTLDLVADEFGCPTYAPDLASAVVDLLSAASSCAGAWSRVHHIVNAGLASRAEWAREVLRLAGLSVPTRDVPQSTWPRPSTPPRWGVLEPTPLPGGQLRDWRAALGEYLTTEPEERP